MLPLRPSRCILAAVAAATLGACHPGGQAEHTPAAAPEAQAVDAGAPVLAAVQNARAAIAAGDPVAAFNDVNLGIGYAVQLVGAEFDALPVRGRSARLSRAQRQRRRPGRRRRRRIGTAPPRRGSPRGGGRPGQSGGRADGRRRPGACPAARIPRRWRRRAHASHVVRRPGEADFRPGEAAGARRCRRRRGPAGHRGGRRRSRDAGESAADPGRREVLKLAATAVSGGRLAELRTQLVAAQTALEAYRGAPHAAEARAVAAAMADAMHQPGGVGALAPAQVALWSGVVGAWS